MIESELSTCISARGLNAKMEIVMKETPELYINKDECCGCSACYSICPRSAIQMQEDEEGFLYPKIDSNKCVNCRLCTTVCPLKS